jgi:hypothetical protein
LIATLEVNLDSGTIMKEIDYLKENPNKLGILRKNTKVEDPMEQEESEPLPKRSDNILKFIIKRFNSSHNKCQGIDNNGGQIRKSIETIKYGE